MELPYIRAEIERMRLQVRRQRKDIQALHPRDEPAGVSYQRQRHRCATRPRLSKLLLASIGYGAAVTEATHASFHR
jgi:hypothetical protein